MSRVFLNLPQRSEQSSLSDSSLWQPALDATTLHVLGDDPEALRDLFSNLYQTQDLILSITLHQQEAVAALRDCLQRVSLLQRLAIYFDAQQDAASMNRICEALLGAASSNVQQLELTGHGSSWKACARQISRAIHSLPTLQHLSLRSFCAFDRESLQILQLDSLNVRSLRLWSKNLLTTTANDNDVMESILRHNTKLHRLEVTDRSSTSDIMGLIRGLRHNTTLRELVVGNCCAFDTSLLLQACHGIQSLCLTDGTMDLSSHVANLQKLVSLEFLHCSLTNAKELASLLKNSDSQLERLVLCNCQMESDHDLVTIVEACKTNSRLKRLDVSHTDAIGPKTMHAVSKALPFLSVNELVFSWDSSYPKEVEMELVEGFRRNTSIVHVQISSAAYKLPDTMEKVHYFVQRNRFQDFVRTRNANAPRLRSQALAWLAAAPNRDGIMFQALRNEPSLWGQVVE